MGDGDAPELDAAVGEGMEGDSLTADEQWRGLKCFAGTGQGCSKRMSYNKQGEGLQKPGCLLT